MADPRSKIQNSQLKKPKVLSLPMNKKDVLSLKVGDMVSINGCIVTGRDRMHTFLLQNKRSKEKVPFDLKGTILYHCGPIVTKTDKVFRVISGGPTTSMRVEMYEHQLISQYGLRGVMGKGGMGRQTLDALKESGCAYFHTIGGAAVYLAERVKKVIDMWMLDEFGMTEAMWVFEVEGFPAIVTMDAHGNSLHDDIEKRSYRELKKLVG
jgi:fumarate hydratase class I